jgi:hypothetical protein
MFTETKLFEFKNKIIFMEIKKYELVEVNFILISI